MTDVNVRTSSIISYLSEIGVEGVENIIKNCLSLIHSNSPLEGAAVFTKMERIISASDDLGYVILMVNRRKSSLTESMNKLKDPLFTALVRQARPSTLAIECEIRLQNEEVANYEYEISKYEDLILYLNHLDRALSEYGRLLREKLNYGK